MNAHKPSVFADRIPAISLLPFFLLTFGIAWGVLGLYIFFPAAMAERFGDLSGEHPLFYVAVWAPALAAFVIVAFREGISGLRRFIARVLAWRCDVGWYLFVLIGIPVVFYAGAALKGTLFDNPIPVSAGKALLLALLQGAIKGPMEEFGWRGFALPLLQRTVAPFWAGTILGIIWGLWHLPAFLAGGTQQSGWSFMPFFAGTIAISLVMTGLYNASRGSIFLAALMHFQLMNPLWPEAQPYDTYFLAAIATAMVWLRRDRMFTTNGARVTVVPAKDSAHG